MDPTSTTPSSSPKAPVADNKNESYIINPSEDLLLSFDGEASLRCKKTQKSRTPSSGKMSTKKRLSHTEPQISEDTLNNLPVWVFWYAVFEFLHMEVLLEYDAVVGIAVYMWAALYITTRRQYYE
ncbi:hypothetical protein PISL3812_00135 [Talaromyces islandicus]|uniref:Uncharacterized protein n=1 Tax=Talaromyces islandicus TaxID=28573 RepID=A0A0U1LID9_TALIS|nr:hypothetical protein PISL3812_00135 [Talaromyces islandicus]